MWTEARALGAVMFVQGTLEKLHNVIHLGWFRMFRASGLPVQWGYLSLETGLCLSSLVDQVTLHQLGLGQRP